MSSLSLLLIGTPKRQNAQWLILVAFNKLKYTNYPRTCYEKGLVLGGRTYMVQKHYKLVNMDFFF